MAHHVSRPVAQRVVRGRGRSRRPPSYLVRRGDVYFFQIRPRLPKVLASFPNQDLLKIRIGAVSLRLAQFEALRLADAAEALSAAWERYMHAGNGGNGQNQTAFPFIANADAAERSARAEFLAALTTYFERVKRRLKEPPPHPLRRHVPRRPQGIRLLARGRDDREGGPSRPRGASTGGRPRRPAARRPSATHGGRRRPRRPHRPNGPRRRNRWRPPRSTAAHPPIRGHGFDNSSRAAVRHVWFRPLITARPSGIARAPVQRSPRRISRVARRSRRGQGDALDRAHARRGLHGRDRSRARSTSTSRSTCKIS